MIQRYKLCSAEQPLLEERTNAENIGGNDAESDDDQTQDDRQHDVKHEVMRIALEELTDAGELWHEEKVNQVDVKCTAANILERHSYG